MPAYEEFDDPDISAAYYDEAAQSLIVYFRRGGARTYSGITPALHARFLRTLDLDLVADASEAAAAGALDALGLILDDADELEDLDLQTRFDSVASSAIRAMQYTPSAQNLIVYFQDGAVYSYGSISERVYEAMKSSTSIGRFFNKKIR